MQKFPDIYVLRHGQTEWNSQGRFQGQLDSPLTELGVNQAKQQGVLLGKLSLDFGQTDAFCSPQLRASRTARLAGLTARSDARLKEVYFGDFEGKTRAEIQSEIPDFEQSGDFSWHFKVPGGESFEQMHSRCLSFLSDLTRPTVIVTHGITSRVLRGIWLGLEMDEMGKLDCDQGCVYCLSKNAQTVLAAPK
ncbi:MAG: broad specificity phosphatase PhoE [Paracoccaceae bacterium]|jgi:broad specificity phosphatase PhoE